VVRKKAPLDKDSAGLTKFRVNVNKCAGNTRRRYYSAARGRRQGSGAVSLHQHDAPLPRAGPWNASDQLDLLRLAAAAVVLQAADQITHAPVTVARNRQMRFVQIAFPAAGGALHPEIPTGE
jgi:hypothetical protein